jgi:glycosyltransferase involved in cell wall biosynthesis
MHIITGLDIGGAEMMLLKLLSAADSGWDSVVVSLTDEGTIGPRIVKLGVPVYSLGLRPRLPNPLRVLTLRRIANRLRPHLIQGWMYHGNLLSSLAGAFSRDRVPVLWNIRQSLYDLAAERKMTAAVIRRCASLSSRAAAIVYVSRVSAEQHEELGYQPSKRVLIPNGTDCDVFQPDGLVRREVRAELGISEDTILVGLVARYHPLKDHAGFLKAAFLVSMAHPEVRFLLIGKGLTPNQPEFATLISELNLNGRVLFLGERSDIPRLTASLDVACSSSWGEGFSNAIGEAMACGVPCVVTDVGDSAYLVGDTGVIVPSRNPKALAHAMGQLIDAGSAKRKELGMAARRRIESEFSLPTIVRRYADLYRSHIGAGET